jgi:hypothetical protein
MSSLALMAAAELETKWFPMLLNASILAADLSQAMASRILEGFNHGDTLRAWWRVWSLMTRAFRSLLMEVAVHSLPRSREVRPLLETVEL